MEEYFRTYGVLAIFLMVAVTVPLGMLALSRLAQFVRVRPAQSTKIKRTSYESGLRPFSPRAEALQYALLQLRNPIRGV